VADSANSGLLGQGTALAQIGKEKPRIAKSTGETVMADEQEDKTIYKVVLNHEEQYSIWPAHRENALGWKDAGKSGTKEECLAYIKEVWTDMRPLSLRKKMQEQGLS
jgi:MbtH protein